MSIWGAKQEAFNDVAAASAAGRRSWVHPGMHLLHPGSSNQKGLQGKNTAMLPKLTPAATSVIGMAAAHAAWNPGGAAWLSTAAHRRCTRPMSHVAEEQLSFPAARQRRPGKRQTCRRAASWGGGGVAGPLTSSVSEPGGRPKPVLDITAHNRRRSLMGGRAASPPLLANPANPPPETTACCGIRKYCRGYLI